MPLLGCVLLLASMIACRTPATSQDVGARSAASAGRGARTSSATFEAVSYFPDQAVDGRCRYAAPYRAGANFEEYLRASVARLRRDIAPNIGVFAVDLDCFASLTSSQLRSLEVQRLPQARYVAQSLRLLRQPREVDQITSRDLAGGLRLDDARRHRFGDPLLLVARKAEREGNLACAWQLTDTATDLGLAAAHQNWNRLYSAISSLASQGIEVPSQCNIEF